ncbi:MAG: YciI family protein [Alphaproteobacteria bacterium]
MSNYIIAYHGGKMPESPEEGAKHMAKWKAWISGLGDAVINPGTPLGKSKIVSSDGVSDDDGSNTWSGFCIVEADSMDAALEMAKGDPFLDTGGTLEVAEVMKM